MRDIKEVVIGKEYEFLRTNKHLKDKLVFLTFGGSHAYGTATAESDVDIRGCAFNSREDLIGLGSFEQVVDTNTDTTVYGFNKLVSLFANVNPNSIEMLGCKPEHYVIYSPVAQEMIENRKMFLSRRAVNSFGGYANQQLRRLQNAVARDALSQPEKEIHMLGSVKSSMMSFCDRYESFDEGTVKLYIGKSNKEGLETEILMDVNLAGYPLRDYKSMWAEMNEVVKVYGKLNHRNNKKDELHLNKHAQHLIRLYLMAIDIFEKEEIITYRTDDLALLASIRSGKYMNEDGTYRKEFFELVDEYEKKLEYAVANSSLPEQPDYKRIEDFVMSVNERVVSGEY
ncbi:MAG: nucleotidyltransferase domain-containing protein [Clostridiales bacterium]|nr:nucleotidyltransferase domain-containing protein [Clostridiales bacterium]